VRVASFNLLHGRSPADGRVDVERLARTVAALDADLLALQEVDRSQPRSGGADLTEVAARALEATAWRFAPTLLGTPGGSQAAEPAGGDGHVGDVGDVGDDGGSDGGPAYGIGLVSRFPVSRWEEIALPRAPVRSPVLSSGGHRRLVLLPDEPRIALVAVVEAPAGPLTVATTHLSFVPGWNAHQLRLLTRRLAELPGPRLLLGDLNLPGPLPGWVSGWRSLARVRTYPAKRPWLQLDHVLASGWLPAVLAARAPSLDISDHRALVIDLGEDLDPPAGPAAHHGRPAAAHPA
jgi:endonuclease/exonuclease/phosphatase family metal-dependent hydrolase